MAEQVKPLGVIKQFFAPDAKVAEMQAMIAGFSRPLNDDPAFVWLVNEAAKELGVEVAWPPTSNQS